MLTWTCPDSSDQHDTGALPVFRSVLLRQMFVTGENSPMTNEAEKRGQLIRHLEDALEALADEIEDGQTGFLIERALDEARSRQFRPIG